MSLAKEGFRLFLPLPTHVYTTRDANMKEQGQLYDKLLCYVHEKAIQLTGVFAATWAIEWRRTDASPIVAHSSIVTDTSIAQFLSCTHSEQEVDKSFISAAKRLRTLPVLVLNWVHNGWPVAYATVCTCAYPLPVHV